MPPPLGNPSRQCRPHPAAQVRRGLHVSNQRIAGSAARGLSYGTEAPVQNRPRDKMDPVDPKNRIAPAPRPAQQTALNLVGAIILAGINAYICRNLFGLGFSEEMASVESVYISISRYATLHWKDLGWFPLWFTGMPFGQVYQPGFHLAVAALSSLLKMPAENAYHLLAALVYCFGPVTLYLLCLVAFRSRLGAFISASVYSLVSPVLFFSRILTHDTGGGCLIRGGSGSS